MNNLCGKWYHLLSNTSCIACACHTVAHTSKGISLKVPWRGTPYATLAISSPDISSCFGWILFGASKSDHGIFIGCHCEFTYLVRNWSRPSQSAGPAPGSDIAELTLHLVLGTRKAKDNIGHLVKKAQSPSHELCMCKRPVSYPRVATLGRS